jgi:hypothetical protein
MNISKVRNSASFVNYVKPVAILLEMEVEENLLLTASGDSGSVRFGASVNGAGNTVPGATNGGRWSSTPGATGSSGIKSVGSAGKYSF